MVTGRAGIRAAALAALPLLTAAAQTPPADPPFIVRTELSERSPWERSQVLYTVRESTCRPGRAVSGVSEAWTTRSCSAARP